MRKRDSGEVLAMKILSKAAVLAKKQVEHTQAERAILESMDHPFLARLRYAFQTRANLYLVLPYIGGGELFQRLRVMRCLPEEWVRFYVAEIALGIDHLHECGIIFRDIKPENVLIDGAGHVVLTDFGLAKILDSPTDRTTTFCGTPEYVAPEMLEGQPHSMAVDWWALGCLAWELLAGVPPFTARTGNVKDLYATIAAGTPPFPHHFSVAARDFIGRLMDRNPASRLGCTAEGHYGAAIRAHPFFAGVDWAAAMRRELPPPWVPPVTDAADVRHFDSEFTSLPVSALPEPGPAAASGKSHGSSLPVFEGFSYGSPFLPSSLPSAPPSFPSASYLPHADHLAISPPPPPTGTAVPSSGPSPIPY